MTFDPTKFDNPLQIAGIRTGTLDYPNPLGGQACQVVHVATGSGLRFTVALDRGGDIVEASCNQTNLAYLTPNDYKPPNPAYHQHSEWLVGWPGGLVTTAGPVDIGEPRTEGGRPISLHGRFSNTPAAIEKIVQPDPARGQSEISIALLIRDSRMFGPCLEVRRRISCQLGQSSITLRDEVYNRGDEPSPHAMLYHCNFGYPLLDEGARLVYGGTGTLHDYRKQGLAPLTAAEVKRVPGPSEMYQGSREAVVVVDSGDNANRVTRVGLLNSHRGVGVELQFSADQLPRLANWLHYGPAGSYVTALEPFFGSLFSRDNDNHPSATALLNPGESKEYELTLNVLTTPAELEELARCDQPLQLE